MTADQVKVRPANCEATRNFPEDQTDLSSLTPGARGVVWNTDFAEIVCDTVSPKAVPLTSPITSEMHSPWHCTGKTQILRTRVR